MLLLGQYIFINPSCTDLSLHPQSKRASGKEIKQATNPPALWIHSLDSLFWEEKIVWSGVMVGRQNMTQQEHFDLKQQGKVNLLQFWVVFEVQALLKWFPEPDVGQMLHYKDWLHNHEYLWSHEVIVSCFWTIFTLKSIWSLQNSILMSTVNNTLLYCVFDPSWWEGSAL